MHAACHPGLSYGRHKLTPTSRRRAIAACVPPDVHVPAPRQLLRARAGVYTSTSMAKVVMALVAALAVYVSVTQQQAPGDEQPGESRL